MRFKRQSLIEGYDKECERLIVKQVGGDGYILIVII